MEPELHEQMRQALNEGLSSKSFFVWINVTPKGAGARFGDLSPIVKDIDEWLAGLDPDAVDRDWARERRVYSNPAAEVEIHAIPKKPSARGSRAAEIVGNPAPALAGWQ
jgi:hypothetical protein